MRRLPLLLLVAAVLGACTSGAGDDTAPTPGTTAPSATATPVALDAPDDVRAVGVTSAAGVTGAGVVDLSREPTRVEVGEAAWVLGVPTDDGDPAWVTVSPDGASRLVRVGADGPEVRAWPDWDPVRPPVLEAVEGDWRWAATEGAGPVAPVVVTDDGTWVAVDGDGDLRVRGPDGSVQDVPGPFLPDARAVPLSDGRLAVLADPTDAYGHGVLGDAVEATSVAIVDPRSGEVDERAGVQGRVIEGTAPLVGDVDGDGAEDLVVTTSADADGARIDVWPLDGGPRVHGPPIGRGGRWRHQVAVVPHAYEDGPPAVVEVVTPHLDRFAQWLVRAGDELVVQGGGVGGVASHGIGSRNLQQAALVDTQGDGVRDLVGPSAEDRGLMVVDHERDSVGTHVVLPDRVVASNVALVGEGETLAMAVVTTDGILHVWG